MDKNTSETIGERNARVDADKAWELSRTRRLIIAWDTYIIAGGYLTVLNVGNPWLHAFVPAGAYLISTLTLPVFKGMWLNRIYKKKEVK